jgi:hypothetical protein
MKIFTDNQETFQEILDFYYFMEEYEHVFHGHRQYELCEELKRIKESIDKIRDIMDENYSI